MEKGSETNTIQTQGEHSERPLSRFETVISAINATDSELVSTLNSTRPEAQDEFMQDPTLTAPRNTHDNLRRPEVEDRALRITALEEELKTESGLSPIEQRIAEMSLQHNKRKNNFLLANLNFNDNPSYENAVAHRLANEAIWPNPDRDTFFALLGEQLDYIEGRNLSPKEQEEFSELKLMLGPVERPKTPRYKPRPETVKRFSEMANIYFEPIFTAIPDGQEEFTLDEVAALTNSILKETLPENSKWHAEVEPGGLSANVNQHNFSIGFPGRRPLGPTYTRQDLKKILVHEFGTHAMRSIPYEDSQVQMFRTGFPGYGAFEEGVAKVMEQAVDGEFSDAGVTHYISIGLATHMNQNFRQTFEVQKRLGHLMTGSDQSKVMYKSVQRAFRGTDVLPNRKDVVYYNGNMEVWKFIEDNLDDPELFDHLFLSGKTDYTNKDHERISYEAKVGSV